MQRLGLYKRYRFLNAVPLRVNLERLFQTEYDLGAGFAMLMSLVLRELIQLVQSLIKACAKSCDMKMRNVRINLSHHL